MGELDAWRIRGIGRPQPNATPRVGLEEHNVERKLEGILRRGRIAHPQHKVRRCVLGHIAAVKRGDRLK
jgi:hypothetical protein